MKTISERLREHALSDQGGVLFIDIEDASVWDEALNWKEVWETSNQLSPAERRMFCLFVAEALETQ